MTSIRFSWSRDGEHADTSAPIARDDAVYWADGRVLCLALANGKQRWAAELQDGTLDKIGLAGSSVLALSRAARGSRLAWLRREDGVLVHQVDLPDVRALACGTATIALLVPERVGPRDVPWQVLTLEPDGCETARFSVGQSASALHLAGGGTIVGFENAVRGYDVQGSPIWAYAGQLFDATPDAVLARTKDDGLACLDSSTGAVRWTLDGVLHGSDVVRRGRGRLRSRPSIVEPLVVLLDRMRGAAVAVDLETGARRWSTALALGESARVRTLGHANGIVVDVAGRLTILSRETGEVEHVASVRSIGGLDDADATDRYLAVIHHAKLRSRLQVFDLCADARAVAPAPRPSAGTAKPSLASRMKAWCELFARRSDVRILESSVREGPGEGLTFPARIPTDVRALAEETVGLSLRWVFADESNPTLPGAPGGHMRLELDQVFDVRMRAVRGDPTFASVHEYACTIDRANDDGLGLLFAEPGQKHATMAFGQASDNAVLRFESLEAYLTRGAQSAFGRGWQSSSLDSRTTVARLRAASLEANTPISALVASLVARGTSGEMAEALVDWLQADVVLLLEASLRS